MRRRRTLVVPFIPGPDNSGPVVPTWAAGITAGEWGAIGGSTLSSSGVMQTNADAIIAAWGHGLIVTGSHYVGSTAIPGPSLVIWGGGHNDYSGNELYTFGSFNDDAPAWRRPRDPTSPAPTNSNGDGSGNPTARHTYQSGTYLPAENSMLWMGGLARATDANGISVLHEYDFDTVNPNSVQPWSASRSVASFAGAADVCCRDPSTGFVWYHAAAQNHVGRYDPVGDAHVSGLFKSPPWGSNASCAIDETRGLWFIYQGGNVYGYRLNNGVANDYYTVSTTVLSGAAPTGDGSIIRDPVEDCFVVWSNSGKSLYRLEPPANPYSGGDPWGWNRITPAGGVTPSGAAGTNSTYSHEDGTNKGTYGRFALVEGGTFRGYALLNRAQDPIYFYRAA